MGDNSQDKFREARDLFDESKNEFFEAHDDGMESLANSTGREQAGQLDDAIQRERRAIEKMSGAIDLQQEAIGDRLSGLEKQKGEEKNIPSE